MICNDRCQKIRRDGYCLLTSSNGLSLYNIRERQGTYSRTIERGIALCRLFRRLPLLDEEFEAKGTLAKPIGFAAGRNWRGGVRSWQAPYRSFTIARHPALTASIEIGWAFADGSNWCNHIRGSSSPAAAATLIRVNIDGG